MSRYLSTHGCRSSRRSTSKLMGPVILVTLGVLFLLDQYDIVSFDDTWPVLLIVIGVLLFAARRTPTDNDNRIPSIDESDTGVNPPGQAGADPQVKI